MNHARAPPFFFVVSCSRPYHPSCTIHPLCPSFCCSRVPPLLPFHLPLSGWFTQGKLADPETYTRVVVLHVVRAKGLIAADSNGTSDAYAVMQVEGAINPKPVKTKVKKATLDPE